MSRIIHEAAKVLVSLFMVLAVGLCMNAWYQAEKSYRGLERKVQLAAFMAHGAAAQPAQVLDAINRTAQAERTVLVTPEAALDKAMKESPAIKDILVTGDNPFTAYFLVTPKAPTIAEARRLKDVVSRIEGIDDVGYDHTLFSSVETYDAVRNAYRHGLTALAAIIAVAALVRTFFKARAGTLTGRQCVLMLLRGCAAGLIAVALWAAFGGIPVLDLPSGYVWLLVPGAVLAQFAHDHE